MASARSKITNALVSELKTINGTGKFVSDLYANVEARLKFWDEVDDYPSVFINTGTELREYQPGGFKWAYLQLSIRIYVQDEEPEARLEEIFEDIEKIVDDNGNLEYATGETLEDLKILSITTDEGLLNPIGVGEIVLQAQYALQGPC